MRMSDMIRMALRNLWKRKLRTALTVLGVIIGTASIVVMVSVGIGMNMGFEEQLSQIGSLTVIDVYKPWSNEQQGREAAKLDLATLEEMRQIDGVEVVTPVINQYFLLVSGRYVADFSVTGILPEAMEPLGYQVVQGRCLQEGDTQNVVLGATVAENFYNPKLSAQVRWNSENLKTVDPMNDKFQISVDYNYGTNNANKQLKNQRVNVVGVLDPNSGDSWSSVMPIDEVEKLVEMQQKANGQKVKKGAKEYDTAKVKVAEMDDVDQVMQQIQDMGFECSSLKQSLDAMQETSKMLRMVLGAIGAISMIVAAISITNTMVMSIYERTREIGVMKVIGATLPDIRNLFLMEAAFIGLMGGVLGVVLSFAVSRIVNFIGMQTGQNTLSYIPFWLAALGIGFATLVGILAGYFPARRAMKLSALAAIRSE